MKLKKLFFALIVGLLLLATVACDGGYETTNYRGSNSNSSNSSNGSNNYGSSSNKSNNSSETNYDNVDCFDCYDAGYNTCQGHECTMCGGNGYKTCYGCNGSGSFGGMTCYGCSGSGKSPCFLCDSTGTQYHEYTKLPDSVPSTPSNTETGPEQCQKCEKGKVNCPMCEGTGRYGTGTVPSYGVEGGGGTYEKLCPLCYGAKKQECYTCGGDGYTGD